MNKKVQYLRPSSRELEQELKKVRFARRYRSVLMSTVYTLIVVASIAVLAATLWLPVLRIYGNSMTPTFLDGQIVIALKNGEFQRGDIVAFYCDNKILVKRVIGRPGEWVTVDEDGTVSVNDIPLEEPYVTEKSFGISDLEYPYQVPEGRIFVLGDHRATSVDSRSTAVGFVSEGQIVGKIVFRIWPWKQIGGIR